jgi:serine/threonine protein kinase
VESPLRHVGLIILRQLGIGEFGRVYEALNTENPHWPGRVAVKVDRLGERHNVILDMQATLQISRDLAGSPHVIRIFDAGRLQGLQSTFHVLQFIDGDTLDNLMGLTGREHSSMRRPTAGRASGESAEVEYLERVGSSEREAWRRERMIAPFTRPLSLGHVLDLFTSVLLWVEEVHNLNYAVNDLKAGNIMISRRGQLKGIDMDSYSPVKTRRDLLTDFFFLAMSLWLGLRYVQGDARPMQAEDDQHLRSSDSIRGVLDKIWHFGDVSQVSHGRLGKDDVLDLLVDLIYRCRKGAYVEDAGLFATDIDRLIRLKRTLFLEEIVLD